MIVELCLLVLVDDCPFITIVLFSLVLVHLGEKQNLRCHSCSVWYSPLFLFSLRVGIHCP